MSDQRIATLLQSAAAAQASGRPDAARRALEDVLKLAPDNAAALNSLGVQALGRGDPHAAVHLFGRAAAVDPKAPPLWINLAKAQRLAGDDEGERESLQQVLNLDQRHLPALIRMAELHERLGEEGLAMQRWSGVLTVGRQIEQRSPDLDRILDHAGRYVQERSRAFGDEVDAALASARAGLDRRALRRFDACVDHLLGRRAIYANECAGLHFPFLPADEYFDREHFPWLAELEAGAKVIRAELEALLQGDQTGLRPYVKLEPGTPENKWSGLDNSLDWGAFFLWEYGRKYEEACARCPETAALLERLPLFDLPGRGPNVFFSLLRPGAYIPPHTGVSNARAIIHLALTVPGKCRFRVGGETREWKEGEAFAFDDTIEHEAWNDSDRMRAVLIIDAWNPHISGDEQTLLRSFCKVADASQRNPGIRVG